MSQYTKSLKMYHSSVFRNSILKLLLNNPASQLCNFPSNSSRDLKMYSYIIHYYSPCIAKLLQVMLILQHTGNFKLILFFDETPSVYTNDIARKHIYLTNLRKHCFLFYLSDNMDEYFETYFTITKVVMSLTNCYLKPFLLKKSNL